jgi:hypothetical protein
LINYIIDEIYPDGSSVNPVGIAADAGSTDITSGPTIMTTTTMPNRTTSKPTQYTDPAKEARYQNWLKTQEGAF